AAAIGPVIDTERGAEVAPSSVTEEQEVQEIRGCRSCRSPPLLSAPLCAGPDQLPPPAARGSSFRGNSLLHIVPTVLQQKMRQNASVVPRSTLSYPTPKHQPPPPPFIPSPVPHLPPATMPVATAPPSAEESCDQLKETLFYIAPPSWTACLFFSLLSRLCLPEEKTVRPLRHTTLSPGP
ncbi:unnamed protein product, partial [Pleuronectes platessa]